MKIQKAIVLTLFIPLLQIPAFASESHTDFKVSALGINQGTDVENVFQSKPKKKKKAKSKKGNCEAYGR